jgi:HTH-type transcriptional regulator / antitoxin HipB
MGPIPLRTPADIGALLRAKRRELKMDQAALAEAIGSSRLWISQIERGKPGANLSLVMKALSAVGITLTGVDSSLSNESATRPLPALSDVVDINEIVDRARMKDTK